MSLETINKPNSLRSNLIDALLEIRLSLSIKKIVSPTIAKSEFKKILDDTKGKFIEVKDALDDVFEEYFPRAKKENNVIEFAEFARSKESSFEERGSEKGRSFVKRDGHFNSSSSGNQAA